MSTSDFLVRKSIFHFSHFAWGKIYDFSLKVAKKLLSIIYLTLALTIVGRFLSIFVDFYFILLRRIVSGKWICVSTQTLLFIRKARTSQASPNCLTLQIFSLASCLSNYLGLDLISASVLSNSVTCKKNVYPRKTSENQRIRGFWRLQVVETDYLRETGLAILERELFAKFHESRGLQYFKKQLNNANANN